MCLSAGLLEKDLIRDIWTKPALVVTPQSPVRLCWNDPILLFFGPQHPTSFGAGSGQAPPPIGLGNRAGVRKAGER